MTVPNLGKDHSDMVEIELEATLPSGHTARAPRLADAEAILRVVGDYTTELIGFVDFTLDDVRDALTAPGFDIERDSVVVCAGEKLVAWLLTSAKDGGEQVDIDVVAADPAIADWLLRRALRRAAESGRERGHPRVTLHQGVYRADGGLRELVDAHGFEPATTFHRMRVEHSGAQGPPGPEPAQGVVLRCGTDPDVRRIAHEVLTASFGQHFGFTATPYPAWYEAHQHTSSFDWSQLWVAELDGRPVGMLECNDQFVSDDNCGYVARLGVVPAARGRGIAKYLLRYAFAVDAGLGRTGTILHVDSNNTTPALRLYESVGMRPVLVVDVWQRVLETGL